MINIVVYGRGGQGAKTAAHIIAESCFIEGKHIQSFPEYGPERSGAPMRAFVKVDDKPITDYSPVTKADYVIVIDPSLIVLPEIKAKIVASANKNTIVLVNSKNKVEFDLKTKTFDASGIAIKHLGKDFSNVVLVGAFAKISGLIKLVSIEKSIKQTLGNKPDLLDGNIKAIREAYRTM